MGVHRGGRVDKALNFTDHNNTHFELENEYTNPEPTRQWGKANWKEFKDELMSRPIELRETITEKRLEKSLKTFYTNIDKSLDVACPKTTPKPTDKNNPWWNDDLQEERKKLAKLYKTKCRHPTEINTEIYKQRKNEFAKHCRQAQSRGWNTFTESTDSLDKMNVLRKIYEGKSSNSLEL